jgi:hypothetical protein
VFPYQLVFLLHLGCVVIGFGSSFVYPLLSARTRAMWSEDSKAAYAIDHAALQVSKVVTSPFIYAAAVFGLILAIMGSMDSATFYQGFKFSQGWISAAFVLFFAGLAVELGLHRPNLNAMDDLEEQLASGAVGAGADGGAPKQVAELEERRPRVAMYGGILHVLWLLLMIDMIWKPGR